MTINMTSHNEDLENAFQTFSRLSSDLVTTYQGLEKQVEFLSQELAKAQDGQQQEYIEKERLAKRLAMLLESLPGGVVVIDGDGMVTESNPVAVELLGRPLQGQLWRDVVTRAFRPAPDDGHDISLNSGLRVNMSTCSLGHEPGQILLLKDVTETRRLQDQLSHLERLSSLGEMAASLAHQIRTPLSSALLYAGGLSNEKLQDSDRLRFAGKLTGVLKHLEDLVGSMLAYAHSGSMQLDMISVGQLLRDMNERLEHTIAATDGRFVMDCQVEQAHIMGNHDALLSAFQNLFTNACQIKPQGLVITVTCKATRGDYLQIDVQDNGPGIPIEQAARIFEPFVSEREGGTGLGLAVVQAIIQAHGGNIIVMPARHEGALFRVELPLAESAIPAAEQEKEHK